MKPRKLLVVAALATVCVLAGAVNAGAHCDTLSGPVVAAAKVALERNDVTPILKWVKHTEEQELRDAFDRTLAVRRLNTQARELADRFLFETAVRLHRLGEGEPFTGLRNADPDPVTAMADQALLTGAIDDLVKMLTDHQAQGIRDRFAVVTARGRHAGDSIDAGRIYVAAYVEFLRYVEQLHDAAAGGAHDEDPSRGSR